MDTMEFQEPFEHWLWREVGSGAPLAWRKHLVDRHYQLFACYEHAGIYQREIYHPDKGFFRATGEDDRQALFGILRQIWLIEAQVRVNRGPQAAASGVGAGRQRIWR